MRTLTQEEQEFYWDQGYLIIRNVFSEADILAMRAACDRWRQMALLLQRTWRQKNTVIWLRKDPKIGTYLRGMQWPSYHDPVMDSFRRDPRLLALVKPLIGDHLKQIINQIHWKEPHSEACFPLHRDVRSRRPFDAFRELHTSYVQTGIAIDPCAANNGAMSIVPGSHNDCSHNPWDHDKIIFTEEYANDSRIKVVELHAGDVVMWTPFTVHGGGFNTTSGLDRRFYINGFVKANNCDRGELVWDHGTPVMLDKDNQAFVQFDGLDKHEYAFYPEDQKLVTVETD